MSNRINGDFDQESIQAFRDAYAAQVLSPEDQENDDYTGLPTNVVLNTSPWLKHTGLWKANDGTDKNFIPNQVLVPGETPEEEESDDLSDEELEELLALLEGEDEDEDSSDEELDLEELDLEDFDLLADDILDRSGEEDGMPDDELNTLIDEVLGELEDVGEDEDLSEEEVQQMLDELLNFEDEEVDEEDE